MKKCIFMALPLGMLASCTGQDAFVPPTDVEVSVQEVRTGQNQGQNFLSLDILATDQNKALRCEEGQVNVAVSVSQSPDGPFEPAPDIEVDVRCTSSEGADMAIVVDNSGSEQGYLPWLQEAAHLMVDAIIPREGRASLVRVSTDSAIWNQLTDDAGTLRTQIDELYIRNGWTALFDGIRMGNETLGAVVGQDAVAQNADMDDFCSADRKLGIVVFTDGRENNSAHQSFRSEEYPGDGLDTTMDDLYQLQVNSVTTPIYTVGLGENVDHGGLRGLASATGGRHHQVANEADLPAVFETISEYASASHKFCTELPPDLCGDMYVKVEYEWSWCDGSGDCEAAPITGSHVHRVHLDCPFERNGNVATMLLTLANPGIERDIAKTLATNAVSWVSPIESPRVLVVRDDNHHNEFVHDTEYIHELLVEAGFDATFMDEPADGLSDTDTSDYDVVWFSNPGYPPDDKTSLNALRAFSDEGGGYVLQGDDMTQVWGDLGYSMTSFTGLVHRGNGTGFCDMGIDNNNTRHRYHVMVNSTEDAHPVIAGLEGVEFLYGDDIDTSIAAEAGERVLGWANGVDQDGEVFCPTEVPVISVRTPNE